ncbi:hypothetical protein [Qipengyuania sp. DGS5-3]|uniref:hypothetical protein n=1 Tax=Qipengyuania sp. DGS5-3 TaxID=3349632 RepID=UPI0036D27547
MGTTVTEIPEAQRLSLAHAPAGHRGQWLAFFSLDHALGRIVAGTSEAILGQMRLAWWRDQLGAPIETRPKGNPILSNISEFWAGYEKPLIELVDSWELLLVTDVMDDGALESFAQGRVAPFKALAKRANSACHKSLIANAARCWALTDLSLHLSDTDGRKNVQRLVKEHTQVNGALDRSMRPLTILEGLSVRALKQGRTSLVGDRLSPLFALRLGIFGR